MFLALAALTSLILALVTRRPVGRLLNQKFKCIGLLCVGVAIQALFVRPANLPALSAAPAPGLPAAGGLLYVAALSLLLAFGWANRRHAGVATIGVGLLLNTLAISVNGGQMPVDPGRLAATGSLQSMEAESSAGNWSSKVVAHQNTRLAILGDWIVIPQLSGRSAILSPGDVVIVAGVLLFFMVISEVRPDGIKTAPGAELTSPRAASP